LCVCVCVCVCRGLKMCTEGMRCIFGFTFALVYFNFCLLLLVVVCLLVCLHSDVQYVAHRSTASSVANMTDMRYFLFYFYFGFALTFFVFAFVFRQCLLLLPQQRLRILRSALPNSTRRSTVIE